MFSSRPDLRVALNKGVLSLGLNRPARANAMNIALVLALQEVLAVAAGDSQVRVVLLQGEGEAFSAGQDIGEMQAGSISYREHLEKTYNPLVLQIRQIAKPVVAAIHGACAGAALGMALACDLRLASHAARFVVGFAGVGLGPDSAVSLLLPLTIGLGRAQYYFMTNQPISAQQAFEWGLVNLLLPVETFHEESAAFAARLAGGPTQAFALAKQAFHRAMFPHLAEVLKTEAELQDLAGRSAEHKERVTAFLQRQASPPTE